MKYFNMLGVIAFSLSLSLAAQASEVCTDQW